MPKFSVIIAAYNQEKYICQTIDSILNQTYNDYEIICIDDKSSDKTYEILKEKYRKNQKIKLFQNNENIGANAVFNMGISLAKGEFITFIDGDDFVDKNLFKILIETLNKHNNINSIWYKFNLFYEDKNKTSFMIPFQYQKEGILNITPDNIVNFPFYQWNKIYKRDSLKEDIFFTKNYFYGDIEFYFRYFTQNPEVYVIDKNLYTYRKRKDSITYNIDNHYKYMFKVVENIYEYLVQNNLFEKYKKALLRLFFICYHQFEYNENISKELMETANLCLKNIHFKENYNLHFMKK